MNVQYNYQPKTIHHVCLPFEAGPVSLWLCLRFSQLPLQCQTLVEEQPVVVLAKQRVLRSNDCAAGLGIREGMSAATVRALAGSGPLQLLQRNQAAEQRCLQQLCCWAYSITPTLYPWREDCLQLEIGGCLTLYRGLDILLEELYGGLDYRGYRVRTGLAATPRAAWLLSFTGQGNATLVEGNLAERLAQLPLALLDEFPREVANLNSAGLHTFSDILGLPEAALGRRCGKDFVRCLRQILGQEADLQPDYKPPAHFSDQYWFGYEVRANAELLPAVQYLLQSLCRFLRNTQLQTGEIEWQLIGVDRRQHRLQVRSSTRHSDWNNWYQLARLQFERLQLRSGVECLILECSQLAAGHGASIDLFSPHNQREPLQALLDRLRGRLGLQAIRKISCRDEHVPELALHVGSDDLPSPPVASPGTNQRPFWLMPEPRQLQQRSGRLYWNGVLQLVCGPERIEDNWWHTPVSRDYYIARAPAGQSYWIFHDRLNGQWYIHGLFA